MNKDVILKALSEHQDLYYRPVDLYSADYETVDMIYKMICRMSARVIVDALDQKDQSRTISDFNLGKLNALTEILETLVAIRGEIKPLEDDIKEQAKIAIRDLMNNIAIDEYLKDKTDDEQ